MLFGRDAERERLRELLDGARLSRSGALVIRGEPGIGKTALLADARDHVDDMHVLWTRGVESESELAFAGLHQLLRPVLHVVDDLPAPQTRALKGALGLADRSGDERFLISAACLTLLSELAEERPVLCLVDDAQWLDTPSADALLFVARRVDAEGIVLLFCAREGEAHRFEARDFPELRLTGIDATAAGALVTSRIDGALAPAVRDLVVKQADGNALALVELPAALSPSQLAGTEPIEETLPLTPSIERLFLERVHRLPDAAQQLLSVVAADETGSLDAVARAAAALEIDVDVLGVAEEAGLLAVGETRVELRHPLVRSAIYRNLSSGGRRLAQLTLAGVLEGSDESIWHRATAAIAPDAHVADELEEASERARLPSGHAAAASALRRASELSVDIESRARRLVGAASAAWHAGQPERASQFVDEARPLVSDPHVRAEVEHLRGEIQLRCGVLLDACDILTDAAMEIAPLNVRKALEMLLEAREAAGWAGDTPRTVAAGRQAADLPPGPDRETRFLADLLVGVGRLYEGDVAFGAPLVEKVIEQADDFGEPTWLAWAAGARAMGNEAKEADLMRRAISRARDSAAVDKLTYVLLNSALMSMLDGRLAGELQASEGLDLARAAGLPNAATTLLAMLAWFAAVRGDEDRCRRAASEATASAGSRGAVFATSIADWALGLLELSRRQPDDAATRLGAVEHPYFFLSSAPDRVEACVRAGRFDDARAAAAVYEGFAKPGAPTLARALAARCNALLADGAESEQAFAEALELHSSSDRALDRARTELLLGEHLRRQRRRIESREHLRAAVEEFERLGAALLADRARMELRASGETARKRDPSTVSSLTAQELQVAQFVAQGHSNKEVAAQLFLSPRTIDAHLRSVFAKLEISSRIQLARVQLTAR